MKGIGVPQTVVSLMLLWALNPDNPCVLYLASLRILRGLCTREAAHS